MSQRVIPTEAPIDTESLINRCMGDADFVKEILDIFQEQAAEHLAKLQDRVRAGDADGAREVAHGMKGSAANLSAERLSKLSADLEHAARSGSLEHAGDSVTEIQAELDRCVAFFPTVIERAG